MVYVPWLSYHIRFPKLRNSFQGALYLGLDLLGSLILRSWVPYFWYLPYDQGWDIVARKSKANRTVQVCGQHSHQNQAGRKLSAPSNRSLAAQSILNHACLLETNSTYSTCELQAALPGQHYQELPRSGSERRLGAVSGLRA